MTFLLNFESCFRDIHLRFSFDVILVEEVTEQAEQESEVYYQKIEERSKAARWQGQHNTMTNDDDELN